MKVALLFPGYGSQFVGMGYDLYNTYSLVKQYFKEASDYMDRDFHKLCFSSSQTELNQIDNAYLSIFIVSISVYQVLREFGINPSVVAGYDTGQYAATCAGNGIKFLDGLDLLQKYAADYITLLGKNKYDIIRINGLTSTKLPEFLDKETFIASYQSRTQHLVSGIKAGIVALKEKLRNASGVTLYDEGVGLGLNSELMNPIIDGFGQYLRKIRFESLDVPLISSVDGKPVIEGENIKEEIIRLIINPIAWNKVVDALSNVDLILGIGPKANLLDLVTEKYPDKIILAINNSADVEKAKELWSNF